MDTIAKNGVRCSNEKELTRINNIDRLRGKSSELKKKRGIIETRARG